METITTEPLDPTQIAEAVRLAAPHSDRGVEGLCGWAQAFIRAHTAEPRGLSVEIGSRSGGSALLFLKLLELLYPSPLNRPMLMSVDPYGFKLYDGGLLPAAPNYGHGNYILMRKLLAEFPNHAHFLLTSIEFFMRMHGARYWVPTPHMTTVRSGDEVVSVPTGASHYFGSRDTSFVLLDGEHDAQTILTELNALWRPSTGMWMRPGGIVVVDNTDCDKDTLPGIRERYVVEEVAPEWAIVTGIKK